MHSGFQALRNEMPMNVRGRKRRVPITLPLQADIARVDAIWADCRRQFGSGGSWLFGDFSIADAMFAPVWFRFQTYGADLHPVSAAYLKAALEDQSLREYQEAALHEGHALADVDSVGS